ncbi:hypothetical protein [Streptomyces sp. NPDC003032]
MLLPPPEKCSTLDCKARPTHVLEYDKLAPFPDEPVRGHDLVCEECGTAYLRMNRVKRWRPYMARNGAAVAAVPPRIRVRVQFDEEPNAYPRDSDWWDDKDAAEMRAGRLQVYVIDILDGAGEVIGDCPNRLAGPGHEGVYQRPAEIQDEGLAYSAADHWTPHFGIEPGDLVTFGRENLVMVNYEQVDHEYGDVGYNTGFILCQPVRTSAVRLLEGRPPHDIRACRRDPPGRQDERVLQHQDRELRGDLEARAVRRPGDVPDAERPDPLPRVPRDRGAAVRRRHLQVGPRRLLDRRRRRPAQLCVADRGVLRPRGRQGGLEGRRTGQPRLRHRPDQEDQAGLRPVYDLPDDVEAAQAGDQLAEHTISLAKFLQRVGVLSTPVFRDYEVVG